MFTVRQRSIFSGFTYDIFDARGQTVATLVWPDFAVAKNARLRSAVPESFATEIALNCQNANYTIAFEYLNRAWENDIRFTLQHGIEVLASVDGTRSKKLFTRPEVAFTQPFSAKLVRTSGPFTAHYELQAQTGSLGTVGEKSGIRFRRELRANLHESISQPVQFFVIFLVLNHAYR